MEFHLSRPARERLSFDRDLLKGAGAWREPDPPAIRELVARMNGRLGPGYLFALVLLQYILHRVILLYRRRVMPDVFERAEDYLEAKLAEDRVRATVRTFAEHYPPLPVYHRLQPLGEYLERVQDERAGRHVMLERMLLVFLANINPAAATARELYDDRELPVRDDYLQHVWSLESFFAEQPPFGPGNLSLFDLLSQPAKAAPESLLDQLEFIRREWLGFLGEEFEPLLKLAADLVREDNRWLKRGGPGTAPDLEYLRLLASRAMFAGAYSEPERFTADTEWMPRAVVIAKSVYVWLDQLAKEFNRPVRTLRDIPDEALDRLASWGFTGLWLIGLWERSAASRTIKHLRGNIDAVASAYSVYDYRISGDLGGDEALADLRERAMKRGIRLASDLVPNHMGLDSCWVREHPDWFLQLDYPPYAVYRFEGPDLSGDPNLDLRIEDGYWHQTDAAVVFRYVDKRSGRTRYIYHGNDGTSMPWNDTAQLNFLLPEVREAVIQLILHAARQFPILRFDAAMTLTKKHYQRLWFPEPGTGGAIPSRALHGMTREEFDRHMPQEFWREVVDRVAAEAPDTLLIAEAFWLLEGYFVRTLGMHRVYNSAFMNMLKLEENAKYRSVIKNVLEFDPRVLQRFVNFMNNPDEETAVAQFGKGDKYFGVCLMMVTMPGLPMFGHGQIEGLTEKYGHEYQRAYYDERPDEELIRRHERDIFPVLRQRHLFSGAEHFLLYDVYREDGGVDENVFAFSNGYGEARALVVYHNRYAETAGWIRVSAAFSVPDGDTRRLVQKTLAEGLGLRGEEGLFYILKDRIAGLEYLRRGRDLCEQGLFVSLRAYQCQVFTEFREVRDDAEGRWSQLAHLLGGRGVPSVEREFKRVYLAPLISAFERFCTAERMRLLFSESPPVHAGTEGGLLPGQRGLAAVGAEETPSYPPASRGAAEIPPFTGGQRGVAGDQQERIPSWDDLPKEMWERARAMRKEPTAGEKELWWRIRGEQMGVKFRRQHPLGPFIVDFYCADHRLAVEVDGDTHADPARAQYDRERDRTLARFGIRVKRYRDSDVLTNISAVLEDLRDALGVLNGDPNHPPLPPREQGGEKVTEETPPYPPASRGVEEIPPFTGGHRGVAGDVAEDAREFFEQARHFGGGTESVEDAITDLEHRIEAARHLDEPSHAVAFNRTRAHHDARDHWIRCVPERRDPESRFSRILGGYLLVWGCSRLLASEDREAITARRVDDWLLGETLARVFTELGASESEAWREVDAVRVLLAHGTIARTFSAARRFARVVDMLSDSAVQRLIACHPYAGVVWFHRESLGDLLQLLFVTTVLDVTSDERLTKSERAERFAHATAAFAQIEELAVVAEYQLERFRLLLGYAGKR